MTPEQQAELARRAQQLSTIVASRRPASAEVAPSLAQATARPSATSPQLASLQRFAGTLAASAPAPITPEQMAKWAAERQRQAMEKMMAQQAGAVVEAPADPMIAVPVGSSTSQRRVVDPRLLGSMQERAAKAGILRDKAAELTAKADKAEAIEAKAAMGQAELERAQADRAAAAEAARLAKAQQAARAQAEATQAEAARDIDPSRWWSSRTAPQKLALGLANVLGGVLEGGTFGQVRNRAAEWMNAQIDRDIELQQRQRATKARQAEAQERLADRLEVKIANVDERRLLHRQMALGDMNLRLQKAAQGTADGRVQAQFLAAQAVTQDALRQTDAELAQMTAGQVSSSGPSFKTMRASQAAAMGLAKPEAAPKPTDVGNVNIAEEIKEADHVVDMVDTQASDVLRTGRFISGPIAKLGDKLIPGAPVFEATSIEKNAFMIAEALARAKKGAAPLPGQIEAAKQIVPGYGQSKTVFAANYKRAITEVAHKLESLETSFRESGDLKKADLLRKARARINERMGAGLEKIKND